MSKFQDRFCFGIKRESSFSAIGVQRERTDRIPISLQRERTANPERSVYTLHREKTVQGLPFPRERAYQTTQQRRTVKFQKLCGWKTPDITDGVVEWVKIQLQIQGKKDRRLRITTEDLVFRYVPKRRCSGLHDAEAFEQESLHSNYFINEERESTRKTSKKSKSNDVKSNTSISDQTRRLLRSRSKDDMGVLVPPKKLQENLDKYCPLKRSRSEMSLEESDWKYENSSQLKRLLRCAKSYQSRNNEDDGDKDEDEGYGSKTSSAEDKLNRADFGGWDVPFLDIDNEFKVFRSARKPARFSYTHQTTSKSQLYGDSEDEGVKDLDTDRTDELSNAIKYYGTGYNDNTPDYIARLLERTYSQMGTNRDNNDLLKIREIRATRLTLRKISIQDAKETKCPNTEQNTTTIASNNQKEFYDQQKTLVRSNSSLQTDRTQYPLYCTSPELKFNTNSQRPVSKRNVRSIREEHTQRLAQTELLNRTRFPYLDFYRAHSSVNLPLSDLLPAVDRSMKNKNGKNKQYVYENVPNIASIQESAKGQDGELAKTSPEPLPQTLGGPPFRENSKTPETTLKRQPSCILDYYNNSAQWMRSQTTKITDGNNQGIMSLELSMSGIDVEIKRDTNKKKPLGKVRLSGNPDKESKKKLRDAFSRFYNTRSSMKNRDWASDFKYMWNT